MIQEYKERIKKISFTLSQKKSGFLKAIENIKKNQNALNQIIEEINKIKKLKVLH